MHSSHTSDYTMLTLIIRSLRVLIFPNSYEVINYLSQYEVAQIIEEV